MKIRFKFGFPVFGFPMLKPTGESAPVVIVDGSYWGSDYFGSRYWGKRYWN